MKKSLAMLASAAVGALSLAAMSMPAHAAGTVILEGSDAIGFHSNIGNAFADAYRDQTFSAIGGSDARRIAVIGRSAFSGPIVSGSHAIVDFASLASAGALNSYVAIYFTGNNGCCSSGSGYLAGRQADVTTYVAGGGTVEIGDYDGNAGWDFLVGGSGNSAFVAGVSGALGGPGCTDGETVTAAGTANGFTQPGLVGCWTHQAYAMPHFASLGFTKSFFNAAPAFQAANPGFGAFSSLLSNGNTVTGGVPEPTTWALMLTGFGLAGGMLRARKRMAVAA